MVSNISVVEIISSISVYYCIAPIASGVIVCVCVCTSGVGVGVDWGWIEGGGGGGAYHQAKEHTDIYINSIIQIAL